MPASHALLCAFIAEHKGMSSGRTIKSWLSGIRAFHLVNQAEWLGDNAWVKMARITANKEGSHHKRVLSVPLYPSNTFWHYLERSPCQIIFMQQSGPSCLLPSSAADVWVRPRSLLCGPSMGNCTYYVLSSMLTSFTTLFKADI